MHQLQRLFPVPEELSGEVWFEIKTFPHDFGSYREVAVVYNYENRKAIDYASNCDKKAPQEWDAEALQELGLEPRLTA
jgi:lipocalin